MRSSKAPVCEWCARPCSECYIHCHEAKNGKHQPDGHGFTQADGVDFVVDVSCKVCGRSGSTSVSPRDILWE